MKPFGGLPPWVRMLQTFETLERLSPLMQWQERVRPAFLPILESLDRMQAAFRPVADRYRHWQETIAPALQELFRHATLVSSFSALLLRLGWPPVLGLPSDVMEELINACEDMDEADAKEMLGRRLTEVYDAERMQAVSEEWTGNPLLARRLHILMPIVKAHQDGHYALTVPSLLPQLEGLIADGFGHQGQMRMKNYKQYVERLLTSDEAEMTDPVAKEFILSIVLASFEHGEELPDGGLSRHAILHGADTDYPTATNSLKAILLFDYLQAAFMAPPPPLPES